MQVLNVNYCALLVALENRPIHKMAKEFIDQMALSTHWVAFQHPAHQVLAQEFNFSVFSQQFNIAGRPISFSRWKIHILLVAKFIIHRPMAEVFLECIDSHLFLHSNSTNSGTVAI